MKKIIVTAFRPIGIAAIIALTWFGAVAFNNREAVGDLKVIFVGTVQDADCIVMLNEDHCVMIDTGEAADGAHIAEVLHANGVKNIDNVILTHPDQDHIGGTFYILDQFEVTQVSVPYYSGEKALYQELLVQLDKMHIPVQTLYRNRLYTYGDLDVRVLSPQEFHYKDSNEYSLAVLAKHGEHCFFFAGDAKGNRLDELLTMSLPEIDVYKLARHGRDSDKALAMLRKLSPEYAVVTALQPEEETEQMLQALQAKVYLTVGQDHVFISSEKGLVVE